MKYLDKDLKDYSKKQLKNIKDCVGRPTTEMGKRLIREISRILKKRKSEEISRKSQPS